MRKTLIDSFREHKLLYRGEQPLQAVIFILQLAAEHIQLFHLPAQPLYL